jgi:thioredoxin 2
MQGGNDVSTGRLDDRGVITACPHCGQKNRTLYERVGEEGNCGKCKQALPPPAEPLEADSAAHFDRLIQDSALPVVVDFWAPWCGPCRMVAPELVKVAAKSSGKFLVVKVNAEALSALGQRYAVQSIPLMAVFHRGRELGRSAGARPAAAIETFIHDAILRS